MKTLDYVNYHGKLTVPEDKYRKARQDTLNSVAQRVRNKGILDTLSCCRSEVSTDWDSMRITLLLSFSVECTIYIKFRETRQKDIVQIINISSEIGWSSSIRELTTALACVNLYQDCIKLAAVLEEVITEELDWELRKEDA